jgi:hypothetical protein
MHTHVKGENVASQRKMANGRAMYIWIGMYAVPILMFLFVVIDASVAFEKKKEKSAFSFSFLNLCGLVIISTRIRIGLCE